jgi:hypothetical protein
LDPVGPLAAGAGDLDVRQAAIDHFERDAERGTAREGDFHDDRAAGKRCRHRGTSFPAHYTLFGQGITTSGDKFALHVKEVAMPFTFISFHFLNGTTLFHSFESEKADALIAQWREAVKSGNHTLFENIEDPNDPHQAFTFSSSTLLYIRRMGDVLGMPMQKDQDQQKTHLRAVASGITVVPGQPARG